MQSFVLNVLDLGPTVFCGTPSGRGCLHYSRVITLPSAPHCQEMHVRHVDTQRPEYRPAALRNQVLLLGRTLVIPPMMPCQSTASLQTTTHHGHHRPHRHHFDNHGLQILLLLVFTTTTTTQLLQYPTGLQYHTAAATATELNPSSL